MLRLAIFILVIFCTALAGSGVQAQLHSPEKGVGVNENVDAVLPLHLQFKDHNENKFQLRHFFENDRPVILTLNYSDCPMLCNLQLAGLVTAMREMKDLPLGFEIGKDFDIVTISIDPNESAKKIRDVRDKYTFLYGDQNQTKKGWHFLRGNQSSIQEVAKIAGFQYHFVRATKEYAHPPVFMVCSSEGRILRYVHGVSFDAQEFEAIMEKSKQGESGKSLGQFIFSCLMMREFTGKNSAQMLTVMRFGGVATVIILGGCLLPFWLAKSRSSEGGDEDNGPKDLDSPEKLNSKNKNPGQ